MERRHWTPPLRLRTLKDVEGREPIKPWWGRIPEILTYPFNSTGLVAMGFLVVVDILRGFTGFGFSIFISIFMYFIFTGIIISVLFSIIRNSADGHEEFPLVDFSGDIFADWVSPAVKFTAMSLVLWGPVAFFAMTGVFGVVGEGGAGVLVGSLLGMLFFAALAMFIFPMATMILAMSESFLNAINPIVWFQILSRVFVSYLAVVIPAIFLSQALMPLPGFLNIIGAPFKMYFALCGAHLLGWFVFQNHERLGHKPRTLTQRRNGPAAMPQMAPGAGPGMQPSAGAPAPGGEQPPPRQLPDMSLPEMDQPDHPGAFTGGGPSGAPGQRPPRPQGQQPAPQPTPQTSQPSGWDPFSGAASPSAGEPVQPGGWDPFAGAAPTANPGAAAATNQPVAPGNDPFAGVVDPPAGQAGPGANGGFLELDDEPEPPAQRLPDGFEPSGLDLAEPPPQAAPEPDPPPTNPTPATSAVSGGGLPPQENRNSAVAAKPSPVSREGQSPPEVQEVADRFEAAVAAKNAEQATLAAAELIHALWERRLVQRAHETYRKLSALAPNACLHPNDQIRLARELDALGDGSSALTAWRALVMVHEAHPQAPRALLRCAELYVEMGRADWAKSCLETILTKYRTHEVARVAQIRLKQMG